jgi:hypothetical protein
MYRLHEPEAHTAPAAKREREAPPEGLAVLDLQRSAGNAAVARLIGRARGPLLQRQFLDELLRRPSLAFASMPKTIFLSAELATFVQDLELRAHELNQSTGGEAELGAALGFDSGDARSLTGIPGPVGTDGSFNPQGLDQRRLGFDYKGTVHTHPRPGARRSFSALDFISVMTGQFSERVSVMVCDDTVHVLVRCDDSTRGNVQEVLEQIVVTTMEQDTQGVEGELEITPEEVIQIGKSTQTKQAIAAAAEEQQIVYYVGKVGGQLGRL